MESRLFTRTAGMINIVSFILILQKNCFCSFRVATTNVYIQIDLKIAVLK